MLRIVVKSRTIIPYTVCDGVYRRCRMEGSMIRGVEVGSSAVQYCPLDQLTGAGDTTWTLTSADVVLCAADCTRYGK